MNNNYDDFKKTENGKYVKVLDFKKEGDNFTLRNLFEINNLLIEKFNGSYVTLSKGDMLVKLRIQYVTKLDGEKEYVIYDNIESDEIDSNILIHINEINTYTPINVCDFEKIILDNNPNDVQNVVKSDDFIEEDGKYVKDLYLKKDDDFTLRNLFEINKLLIEKFIDCVVIVSKISLISSMNLELRIKLKKAEDGTNKFVILTENNEDVTNNNMVKLWNVTALGSYNEVSIKVCNINKIKVDKNPYSAGGGKRKSKGKSKKVAKKPVVSQKKQSIYKEILGKQMKIYKMPDSRKEYVKYKGELLHISDYKSLMKQKAIAKTKATKVTKATKATNVTKQKAIAKTKTKTNATNATNVTKQKAIAKTKTKK